MGEKLKSKGFVRDKPERVEQANETKALGRAKNQIRDVHCSGIVQVEQQACLRPRWRLTARPMASNRANPFGFPWRQKRHSADPAGIERAKPKARREGAKKAG